MQRNPSEGNETFRALYEYIKEKPCENNETQSTAILLFNKSSGG